MHDVTKTITDDDLGVGYNSACPCAKCGAMSVWVFPIKTSAHDDHCIICKNCGYRYCVDGDDG